MTDRFIGARLLWHYWRIVKKDCYEFKINTNKSEQYSNLEPFYLENMLLYKNSQSIHISLNDLLKQTGYLK